MYNLISSKDHSKLQISRSWITTKILQLTCFWKKRLTLLTADITDFSWILIEKKVRKGSKFLRKSKRNTQSRRLPLLWRRLRTKLSSGHQKNWKLKRGNKGQMSIKRRYRSRWSSNLSVSNYKRKKRRLFRKNKNFWNVLNFCSRREKKEKNCWSRVQLEQER